MIAKISQLTKQKSLQKGFTIIEIIIVSGLSIMLMLTISSLFMTFMIGNANANMRKTVYAEGNYALNQMSFLIRNATSITCTTTPNPVVTLTSIDGGQTAFKKMGTVGNYRIASESAVTHFPNGGFLNLTSSEVDVTSFGFTCPNAGDAKYIGIDFQLRHKGSSGTSAVEENFKANVLVRN